MDWENFPIAWIAVAAALIVTEMLTGTFYLLVLGLSAAAGGIAAWMGASFSFQIGLAVAVGLTGAVLVWRWHKYDRKHYPSAGNNLDIGHPVNLEKINPNGSWQVIYRGASWQARPGSPATNPDRPLFIVEMQGNLLIVDNK